MRWITVAAPPVLTRGRIRAAYGIAIAIDILQLALGPIGWAFSDEVLDVMAMGILWRILGFHPLFLPSFVLELVPVADLLPTWTGCVALVVLSRKRQQMRPPDVHGPVIDI